MLIESAIEILRNVIVRPGYRFDFEPAEHRHEGTVLVHSWIDTVDTGRTNGMHGWPEKVEARQDFYLPVGDCVDAVELLRRFLHLILRIEEHEWREFLRLKPSGWAPFHPHQIDGMERWGSMNTDLTYGLAK